MFYSLERISKNGFVGAKIKKSKSVLMKILFAYPIFQLDGFSFFQKSKVINLGLLYLAAVTEKNGHEAIIRLVNKFNIQKILKKVKPDVLAITSMYLQYPSMVEIIKKTKEFDKDIVTIAGGYHPTFRYEKILKECKELDYIVVGEGEKTFEEFLTSKEREKIKGLAFRKGKKIIFTGKREFIKDLDSIPFPARHLINFRVNYVISSRGCPFNCRFCCIKNFYERTIRRRSVANTIEELRPEQI